MKVKANGAGIFWMPLPDFSQFALPAIGGNAQVLDRAREGFEKMQAVSQEITEAVRESCANQSKSATDYGLKVFELSNANAAAAMDFMIHLGGSKSPNDVLQLSAAQTRKAFVTASDQNRELWTLAQKLAAETARPLRQRFSKALHPAG